jgi:hypothetical protein
MAWATVLVVMMQGGWCLHMMYCTPLMKTITSQWFLEVFVLAVSMVMWSGLMQVFLWHL